MYHNPAPVRQTITPELARLLEARARVEAALAAQSECLRKLKALDQLDREAETVRLNRRPTLVGVAPQTGSSRTPTLAAACLGKRPSGRY